MATKVSYHNSSKGWEFCLAHIGAVRRRIAMGTVSFERLSLQHGAESVIYRVLVCGVPVFLQNCGF